MPETVLSLCIDLLIVFQIDSCLTGSIVGDSILETQFHRVGHCGTDHGILIGHLDADDHGLLVNFADDLLIQRFYDTGLSLGQAERINLFVWLWHGIREKTEKPRCSTSDSCTPPCFLLFIGEIFIIGHRTVWLSLLLITLDGHWDLEEACHKLRRLHQIRVKRREKSLRIIAHSFEIDAKATGQGCQTTGAPGGGHLRAKGDLTLVVAGKGHGIDACHHKGYGKYFAKEHLVFQQVLEELAVIDGRFLFFHIVQLIDCFVHYCMVCLFGKFGDVRDGETEREGAKGVEEDCGKFAA